MTINNQFYIQDNQFYIQDGHDYMIQFSLCRCSDEYSFHFQGQYKLRGCDSYRLSYGHCSIEAHEKIMLMLGINILPKYNGSTFTDGVDIIMF